MSPVIAVDLNLFTLEIPVTLVKDQTKTEYKCQMPVLSEFIAELASSADVKKVYIYSSKEKGAPVAEEICFFAKRKYNNNNLEVEVITR